MVVVQRCNKGNDIIERTTSCHWEETQTVIKKEQRQIFSGARKQQNYIHLVKLILLLRQKVTKSKRIVLPPLTLVDRCPVISLNIFAHKFFVFSQRIITFFFSTFINRRLFWVSAPQRLTCPLVVANQTFEKKSCILNSSVRVTRVWGWRLFRDQ